MSALPEDRLFDPDPDQKRVALELYGSVRALPLVCPHGHVDLRLFASKEARFGNPAELLIIPDHYVFRMLHSQGVALERLGVPRRDGGPVEDDPRQIWQVFAEHFHLFRGTPTGIWLRDELSQLFDVTTGLNGDTAQQIYDAIEARLNAPDLRPRALYERFNIEVLCTTDAATDPLEAHRAVRNSGWGGRILPTFRPDAVVNLDTPGWHDQIDALGDASGVTVVDYPSFIRSLEARREHFRDMGAKATDHAALTPHTGALSDTEAEAVLQRALKGQASREDALRFTGHMLMEMARMSVEDGLVMQLHAGSWRNYHQALYDRFGPDKGADIPVRMDFASGLHALLNRFGDDPRLTFIVFTLDETAYARELAPLAGFYPALRLGPPWWFHDSPNGIRRYLDQVVETAGLHNTVGFNDDTRAFPSIPARHDLWRRVTCNWLAGLVVRHIVHEEEAYEMARELAYDLAREAYRLT